MNLKTKIMLGKILGELYRIQNSPNVMKCPASSGRIYGLLNGIEDAIDADIQTSSLISTDKVDAVCEVLNPIFSDPTKLQEFTGFYDIEEELDKRNVDRSDAIRILTYLYADGKFSTVIEKMNSQNSPIECKTFELTEWDK